MHLSLRLAALLLLVAAISLAACVAPAAPAAPVMVPATTITLAGAGDSTAILRHALAPFQRDHPELRLEFLVSSGGGLALQGVQAGEFDLAVLLSDHLAATRLPGLTTLALAEDPLAFLRHPDLVLSQLSAAQLAAIYAGRVTNWRAVGGPDAPVVVLTRTEDEGATRIMRATLFGATDWGADVIVLARAAELREAVQKTPGSIGFGSYGDFVLSGLSAQALAIDGVLPGEATAGAYPIPPRTLEIAYASNSGAALDPLLTYLQSAEARELFALAGLVPIN